MCFPGGSVGKESTCNAGDRVQFLDQEDPLEKEMATHSSILAWRIPWTEELGGLQSMGLQRVRQDWATKPPPYMYMLPILWVLLLREMQMLEWVCKVNDDTRRFWKGLGRTWDDMINTQLALSQLLFPLHWGTQGEGRSRWKRADNRIGGNVYKDWVPVLTGTTVGGSRPPGSHSPPTESWLSASPWRLWTFCSFSASCLSGDSSHPSLTPGCPSVFQLYFRLTCGTWMCNCWVSVSPIFFLGPRLFSRLSFAKAETKSCLLHQSCWSFPVSQQRRLAVSSSHQACTGFTFPYRLNVYYLRLLYSFIHSSNVDVLNNYYA